MSTTASAQKAPWNPDYHGTKIDPPPPRLPNYSNAFRHAQIPHPRIGFVEHPCSRPKRKPASIAEDWQRKKPATSVGQVIGPSKSRSGGRTRRGSIAEVVDGRSRDRGVCRGCRLEPGDARAGAVPRRFPELQVAARRFTSPARARFRANVGWNWPLNRGRHCPPRARRACCPGQVGSGQRVRSCSSFRSWRGSPISTSWRGSTSYTLLFIWSRATPDGPEPCPGRAGLCVRGRRGRPRGRLWPSSAPASRPRHVPGLKFAVDDPRFQCKDNIAEWSQVVPSARVRQRCKQRTATQGPPPP
jgi:hypothetical protein